MITQSINRKDTLAVKKSSKKDLLNSLKCEAPILLRKKLHRVKLDNSTITSRKSIASTDLQFRLSFE